jgi:UPF0755 protein
MIKRPKTLITLTAAALLIIIGGSAVVLGVWYKNNLKPVSSSSTTVLFTISPGTSVHQIAANLKQVGLIRSVSAFETYVTTNNYREKLQAGTYRLNPSMSVQTIVEKLIKGDVAKDLLTILPGNRLDQIKQTFRRAGYSQEEIDKAFNPANYAGHPALASRPKGASLEGYLYPDSYQKQANTPATTIIRQSLDEMSKYLTTDVINGFESQGLSVYEGIILASIVLKESDNLYDQPVVAQVLITRLARKMLLQADATAYYASDVNGVPRSLDINSPYNTYKYGGLPPGPISNVTKQALWAVAHPASTTYLYYVTGDDGQTRFSYTLQEHQDKVQKYCKQRCAQ